MNKASAMQLSFDYSESSVSPVEYAPKSSDFNKSDSMLTTDDYYKDKRYKSLFAESAKIVGRNNALSVSDDELKKLLNERKLLITKKISEGLNRKEICRLEYVNWSLDRIEDARDGYGLDRLNDFVTRYEEFLVEVRNLRNDLIKRSR